MSFTWISVEATTGRPIADLPGLVCKSTSVEVSKYTTTTASLPIASAPKNWERAVLKGGAFLVQVDTDRNVPVWGGLVTRSPRGSADDVSVSLMSCEGYFDRRYVGDVAYVQQGQNLIVRDLVQRYAAAGSNGGIPIRVNVLDGSGALRDRTYTDISDKTLYSVLTELAGVVGGPQWSVSWEMAADQSSFTPVLNVGTRVGSAVRPGLAPAAVFTVPGSAVELERDEDYSSQYGANDVMATSSTDGDTRPQSDHVVTVDPNRPTYEFRWTPSTSITRKATLNSHASKRAGLMFDGSNPITLTAAVQSAPRIGSDWFVGDDVGVEVSDAPGFPGGLSTVVRTLGYELNTGDGVDTITPLIANPDEVSDAA